ncbi:Phenylalanyl-tRNA synthetase subunit beta [Thraustotheca clavata]|uniref:Phenylalanyl-tRNA synthetase subunit beta n=1 Tax=Thraustotheca clavata TaxID=74557 RepID=A0A1W0A2L7_9STRA|nr:Phenylalanyl-tRNA synthetase subunit beta [Thraustotheca clavata]
MMMSMRCHHLIRFCSSLPASGVALKPATTRLQGVVVGEVVKVTSHPQAERLHVCQVAIAQDADPVQIICGAPNVREGLKVPVATIGTRLTLKIPNPNEEEAKTIALVDKVLKIKKSKLRGEVSQGMICSESEIGLAEFSDGIMELDHEAQVGSSIADYLAAKEL